MTDSDVEKVARILRVARACEPASLREGDTIPCPFCHWGPNEDGKPNDETGCFWFAEQIVKAIAAP